MTRVLRTCEAGGGGLPRLQRDVDGAVEVTGLILQRRLLPCVEDGERGRDFVAGLDGDVPGLQAKQDAFPERRSDALPHRSGRSGSRQRLARRYRRLDQVATVLNQRGERLIIPVTNGRHGRDRELVGACQQVEYFDGCAGGFRSHLFSGRGSECGGTCAFELLLGERKR